jgi:hypothetical protein
VFDGDDVKSGFRARRGGRFLNELLREALRSDGEPDPTVAIADNDQLAAIVESPEKSRE